MRKTDENIGFASLSVPFEKISISIRQGIVYSKCNDILSERAREPLAWALLVDVECSSISAGLLYSICDSQFIFTSMRDICQVIIDSFSLSNQSMQVFVHTHLIIYRIVYSTRSIQHQYQRMRLMNSLTLNLFPFSHINQQITCRL